MNKTWVDAWIIMAIIPTKQINYRFGKKVLNWKIPLVKTDFRPLDMGCIETLESYKYLGGWALEQEVDCDILPNFWITNFFHRLSYNLNSSITHAKEKEKRKHLGAVYMSGYRGKLLKRRSSDCLGHHKATFRDILLLLGSHIQRTQRAYTSLNTTPVH